MMSAESIALCREQVALLESALGASPVVVYLAESFLGGSSNKLVPAITEPEGSAAWDEIAVPRDRQTPPRRQLRAAAPAPPVPPVLPSLDAAEREAERRDRSQPDAESEANRDSEASDRPANPDDSYRLVMPLIHENIAVGLLVTARSQRPWSEGDRAFIERIAHTIALACLMERREQWLEQHVRTAQQRQHQQHDLLHDWLHQFRNPLTALRVFGKLLVKQMRPEDDRHNVANHILHESERLQDLLQDFRDAIDDEPFVFPATVDLDPDDAEPAPSAPPSLLPAGDDPADTLNLRDLLEPLLVSAAALADDRDINFHADLCQALPSVHGSRKALTEAFGNLLDNALKYTPAGGTVRVDAGENHHDDLGAGVAVAISDTGPGIPPDDMEHLFERRFRGVQADGDIPGTGLGLAIARDLVRQTHGDIWAFSPPQHPGDDFNSDRGTTFVVWLPQAEPR